MTTSGGRWPTPSSRAGPTRSPTGTGTRSTTAPRPTGAGCCHDYEPNRCFRELSRLGQELRRHGDRLTDLEPEAEVGLLYSQASKHALRFQPCLTLPGQATPDPRSYERIFDACYRACFDAGAQTAIIHPAQAWEQLPAL